MHGFILSAAVAGEGFVKRFRFFAAFSHLSRAAKKQNGEEGETGAETQSDTEYAGACPAVKPKRSQGATHAATPFATRPSNVLTAPAAT
jgi:hypothetical protein